MPATYKPVLAISIGAAVDLEPHRFVGPDGNYPAAGGFAVGVTEVEAAQGRQAPVIALGTALVEAAEAIAKGDPITTDNQGRAVKASDLAVSIDTGGTSVTSTAANGDITTISGGVLPQKVLGYALTAASGAGDIIEVLLK